MKARPWGLVAALVVGAGAQVPLSSQEGASLAEVEVLAAQGRIMEARETLETWWTTRFSVASRIDQQRGIWLRGKLTVDPSMAEMDYRRLVLEFPGGPYTDDALYRTGLSAELRGDLGEARSCFQALVRDYPSSPRVQDAQRWMVAHEGVAGAPADLPVATRSDTERSRGVPNASGDFSVQLGAFRSLEGARALVQRLSDAGHEARIVRTPGNDLARVRVGRFSSREPAEALAQALRGQGFEVTLITDAGNEERVGTLS